MVTVQLSHRQEDRLSEVYGPYEYVELTYEDLWTPDRQEVLAYHNGEGVWIGKDSQRYTDITIAST